MSMRIEEIFYILGMEPTKDENAIKEAYRRKLVLVNPEDDQEGFKRLRKAYEEACSYAKKSGEEKAPENIDSTPSGLWVRQAAALYERFSLRCDKEAWRKLFSEEVFLSLEGNEECRRKLLVFFMNHFNFPHEIWQLFDKYLYIQLDKDRLKEEFPPEFIQFLVQKCEEREAMDYSLFQGPDEGNYDLFLECYRASANALNKQDYDGAEDALERADATGISHPYMEIVRALVYKGRGREEESENLFAQLMERYPDNTAVLFHMSNFYWDKGQREEAWDCCRKLKELDKNNYMANYRLAFYYYEKEDYLSAKDCIQLISGSRLTDEMMKLLKDIHRHLEPELQKRWQERKDFDAVMELARNYYQEERYWTASKLLEEAENSVPKEKREKYLPAYLHALTKIYIGLAENEKAVETIHIWQKILDEQGEKNQDDIIKLRISVCHIMGRGTAGYFAQAEKEYEKIKGKPESGPELLMEMAQIFLEKKDYQKCLELSEVLLDEYRIYFAYVFMLKAYAGLWDAAGVIRCGRKCIEYFPGYAYPYEEMARVYFQTGHMDKLKEILETAEKNKIQSCYLDACAYHGETVPENYPIQQKIDEFDKDYYIKLVATGDLGFYRQGYPLLTKYLRMYPCNFLLNKRGLFCMAAKDEKAAMNDFQKILERDLADAFAYNNIGCLYKYSGEYEKAIVFFNKAIYYMYREEKAEPTATHFVNLAHTYELLGEYRRAAEIYRRIYDEFRPGETAVKGLTVNYARTGKLKEAKSIVENLYANDVPYMRQSLYRIYLYAGEFAKAFRSIHMWKSFSLCGIHSSMSVNEQLWSQHILVWEMLLKGRCEKSLKMIKQAMENFADIGGKKKEQIDIILDRIFILTIRDGTDTSEGRKMDSRSEIYDCLTVLEQKLCWICQKPYQVGQRRKEAEEGWNLLETEEFFYRERYVKYIHFLIALFGQEARKGEEAWKAMAESPRCRKCNHASCMRLKIAEAMLLEQQGKKQQALDIYRKLEKEQPCNLYAKAKLVYSE